MRKSPVHDFYYPKISLLTQGRLSITLLHMTRKILPLLLLILTLPAFAAAEEAKIIAFSGTVEVRNTREGQWAPATENMEIAEGGAVRAGADGSAVLLMPNKTKVWIKESSTLEVEQRRTLASRLALVFGKIKVRVPHLMRKEKFEVRTPSAVCAVRGTELTVDTNEAGAMVINVLYGEVKLSFVVPSEKGKSEFYIPQGRSMSLEERGKTAILALMTAEQEKSSLENWNPGLSPSERRREMHAKDNDRAQIREFARITSGTEDSVKSFLNIVKESDLEAGRTLRDIHGNMVRVDQRLMRPYADEVQFINLVKRPVYNNVDSAVAADTRKGFAYNGAASISDRLDYVQMTMNFNKDLPQRIEEWPSFFSDNDIKADWNSVVMANKTDHNEIFFMAQGAIYNAGSDDLKSNTSIIGVPINSPYASDNDVLIAGVLKTDLATPGSVSAVEGLGNVSRLNIKDNGSGTLKYYTGTQTDSALVAGYGAPVNGIGNANGNVVWAVKMNYDTLFSPTSPSPTGWTNKYEKDKLDSDHSLWNYQATAYAVGGVNSTTHIPALPTDGIMWVAQEASVINNSGAIQQVEDFTKSSLDPFSILKNSAGEIIMSIKKSNNNGVNTWTSDVNTYADISQDDYFAYSGGLLPGSGTNIDLVIIPDLLLAAVQRILPAITNMND